MTLGMRLRDLRDEKDLTQADMAGKVGKSLSAYKLWENDINEPNLVSLITMADYFDVSIDYLIGRSAESYRKPVNEVELKLPPKMRGIYAETEWILTLAFKDCQSGFEQTLLEAFHLLVENMELYFGNIDCEAMDIVNRNVEYPISSYLTDFLEDLNRGLILPLQSLLTETKVRWYEELKKAIEDAKEKAYKDEREKEAEAQYLEDVAMDRRGI